MPGTSSYIKELKRAMEANLSLMYVISLFSVLIAFAFAAYLFL